MAAVCWLCVHVLPEQAAAEAGQALKACGGGQRAQQAELWGVQSEGQRGLCQWGEVVLDRQVQGLLALVVQVHKGGGCLGSKGWAVWCFAWGACWEEAYDPWSRTLQGCRAM